MPKEEKRGEEIGEHDRLSRREFLKDAGLVVGGATLGSMALFNACGSQSTVTTTATSTTTATVNSTAIISKAAETVTSPPVTITSTVNKYICPLDSQEFTTLDALKAHFSAAHPNASLPALTTLVVNGVSYSLQLKPYWTLVDVLREKIGLTGTKKMCNLGSCGFCNVIMDGRLVMSCMVLASECNNAKITTIEGLSNGNVLHPIQQAMIDNKGFECGMCTPGTIMAAKALLDSNPSPTTADIQNWMATTFCRCAQYPQIFKAVAVAAAKMKG